MQLNIKIITENYYFYHGVKESLCNEERLVERLSFSELKEMPTNNFQKNDVLIFNTSNYIDEFLFLISMVSFPGTLVFIPADDKRRVNIAFKKHVSLSARVGIDALLCEIDKIHEIKTSAVKTIKDKLTRREKIILLHTINGLDAQSIGEALSISAKTVYTHRRNALQKLGGRNLFEIWPVKERAVTSTAL